MLAAGAFAACAATFVIEIVQYQRDVVEWACSDLQSRADLAAAILDEPLRTQDFRRIHAFADRCRAEGLWLRITSVRGGCVFDSRNASNSGEPSYWRIGDSGEFHVGVGRPANDVLAPFRRALAGFALACLVGVLSVVMFFFVLYRQRVRIRELAKLEKFRRDFIADVSHEIRTPLTGILGAADMMEGNSPLVPLIKKESKRLNSLVQSILDLARLEREGDVLNVAPTDLAELVCDVASRYPCKCSVDGACAVQCDAQLISQALANLIENALRHSGSDDISVTLSRRGDMAEIAVEDHGIGVPPEERERIFERFHRVDPARAAETGGAGLGLALVRKTAQLHGGDVTFTAVVPHGSRFVISLPNCRGPGLASH